MHQCQRAKEKDHWQWSTIESSADELQEDPTYMYTSRIQGGSHSDVRMLVRRIIRFFERQVDKLLLVYVRAF